MCAHLLKDVTTLKDSSVPFVPDKDVSGIKHGVLITYCHFT